MQPTKICDFSVDSFAVTSGAPTVKLRHIPHAIALSVAVMLSACGGGGGDDKSTPTGAPAGATQGGNAAVPVEQESPSAVVPSFGKSNSGKVVPAEEAKPIIERMKAAAATNATTNTANGTITNLVIHEDHETLFNWAEKTFGAFFPNKQPNQVITPYDFRFYPSTGNYAGVANGRVYSLGPMNNGRLIDHGTLESFACLFKPDRCASPGMLTSVPIATYPIGSDLLEAFNLLNKERARCGFGMMAQNVALDQAATGHLNYVKKNYAAYGFDHLQVPGRPGFTGVSPTDRALSAGYGSRDKTHVSESAAARWAVNKSIFANGLATSSMRNLLNAPYHALGLISSYKEVGSAFGLVDEKNFSSGDVHSLAFLILKPARIDFFTDFNNTQEIADSTIRTYPCQGSVDINRMMVGEVPNPVTPRDLATNPIGSSIMIKVKTGNTLLVTNAGMFESSTGAAVVLLPTMTNANDPNRYLQKSAAVIMPDKPLKPLTSYKVTINGTNNGASFERIFEFKTGKDSR